ncbi:phage tail assembly protein [Paenibacillus sp. 22594]|uniref:phage tail assembly protein n=1 Tax=Paenibacillus sp. 22594 TaxID=3453947 RepID=UPI003F87F866
MANEKNIAVEADERVYTLSRPFVFEEQEYTRLILDFDALTGADLLRINTQFEADQKSPVFVKALSLSYQINIAAAAAKVPVEFFNKLSAKDVSKVGLLAQNFLLI